MDPVLQELLIGLVSNGLSELATRSSADDDLVFDDAVEAAVVDATEQLAEVEAILPALGGERLRGFLLSAEAHSVIRQIFASVDGKQIDDVKREFYELWRVRMEGTASAGTDEVDRLFRSLVGLCNRSLDAAIAAGNLTAIEAQSARRHAEIRGAIEGLERSLGLFANSPALNLQEIDDFAAKYRRQLATREGVITPPALDSARQVPIDSLYVPARLDHTEGRSSYPVAYEEFGRALFRGVVLGNPGSGKSTLAKKLGADVARDKLVLGHRPKGMVPFLVVLRDYGAQKRDNPCSIVDFIASTSNSRYQLTPPKTSIEYLLLTDRAMVIFDGLDELLDTRYRAEISGDVESFATLYPSTPILVTSREVGYQQAPLSPTSFTAFRLASFSDEQVREYARNWFAVDGPPSEAKDQAGAFMADSASVSDLRSNALMLGLMCNLYKGSGYIPRNRPDVYEACAEMLFDRWDRLRQIGKPLNIESLLRPAMQYLAAWIYADGELQSGVTEKALIAKTTDFLLNRRFEDPDEAELEAGRFIDFCRGRAWVFTDTGTTSKGDRLYQFTHRTFLEFFTAGHFVRTNPSPEKLLAVLGPHISVKEWDVVAQLAFQLLDHNVDGAADALLMALCRNSASSEEEADANRLDFAVRTLEFLVPSPVVTKDLVTRSLSSLIRSLPALTGVSTVLALLAANPENADSIRSAFTGAIGDYLEEQSSAAAAAELSLELRPNTRPNRGSESRGFAEGITAQVVDRYGARLRAIAADDHWIATDLVMTDALDIEKCVADHGLEPFLLDRRYSLYPGSGRIPLGEIIAASLLWKYPGELPVAVCLRGLSALASLLTPSQIAKVRGARDSWLGSFTGGQFESSNCETTDLSGDERYALLILLIIFLEHDPRREDAEVPVGNSPLGEALASVLRTFSKNDVETAHAALHEFGLSDSQCEIVTRWVDGSVDLDPQRIDLE